MTEYQLFDKQTGQFDTESRTVDKQLADYYNLLLAQYKEPFVWLEVKESSPAMQRVKEFLDK